MRTFSFRYAAEKAGFDVLRVISEPCAAVLAYDIGQVENKEKLYASIFDESFNLLLLFKTV